jgi:divalent metal cation (Fe/Co/Zn/Cd) transporter
LQATAWDYCLDALGGIDVLSGLATAKWVGWRWADHLTAIVITGAVLWIEGGREPLVDCGPLSR